MAVKVQSLVEYEQNNEIEVMLFADTKEEVSDNMEIDGIPDGKTISYGSSLLTANGDIAFLTSDGHWNFVSGSEPNLEDKTVDPDFSDGDVVVEPSEGYDGLSSVTIEKDSDLIATNVKKDVTINGITGTFGNFETKSLTPDFSNGDVTVSPTSGYDGLSSVTIEKDSDLVAENIKKDVNVFGVVGTLESSGGDIDALIDKSITSIESNVTNIGAHAFYSIDSLVNISFPNATNIDTYAFYNCRYLTNISFPNVTSLAKSAFEGCSRLVSATFFKEVEFASQVFYSCTLFDTLVLKANSVSTLLNTNIVNGTKFAANKTGGTIYVPQALIASYQADTNWSAVLGLNANNQIKAIEGSPYENA